MYGYKILYCVVVYVRCFVRTNNAKTLWVGTTGSDPAWYDLHTTLQVYIIIKVQRKKYKGALDLVFVENRTAPNTFDKRVISIAVYNIFYNNM